jgi:hypothetical protein
MLEGVLCTMNILRLALIPVVLLLLATCGSNTTDRPPADAFVGSDLTSGPDQKVYPDLGLPPDLGQKVACESEWRDAVHAQSKVSTGAAVTTGLSGGIKQTVIDATAGGMNAATQNPFVYLSLTDGKRADLDDFAARTSGTWDLAFRRAVIRVNGGDSGSGQGAIAILSGKTLDQVTAVPASGFTTDDFLDGQCVAKTNAIGDIWTAICGTTGLWYDYDTGTMKLTPKKEAYVVRTAKGGFVRLVIDSYYDTKGAGGHYTIRWSAF